MTVAPRDHLGSHPTPQTPTGTIAFLWALLVAALLVAALLRPFNSVSGSWGNALVLVHAATTVVVLLVRGGFVPLVILGGFAARLATMTWDLYARSIFILPNAGGDTDMYYARALLALQGQPEQGLYAELLGALFTITGPSRLLGQYLNVLLGISILFLIGKSLEDLNIGHRASRIVLILAAIFPTSVIISSILLREIFPTFFVAGAVFLTIKWYQTGRVLYVVMAVSSIGLGAAFHSGVIGLIPGFVLFFVLADRETGRLRARFASIPLLAVLMFVMYFGVIRFGDDLFFKFQGVETISEVYDTANKRLGDSTYLEGVEVDSFTDFVVFGPIKALYFLVAPLPTDWRGIWDVGAFLLDSSLYFSVAFLFLRRQRHMARNRSLLIALFVALASAALVFGVGVGNAGTAMRHRQKLTPVVLVALALLLDSPRPILGRRTRRVSGSLNTTRPTGSFTPRKATSEQLSIRRTP